MSYLEQFKFRLVREALEEREILLRTAHHIVHPLRFALPIVPACARGGRHRWASHQVFGPGMTSQDIERLDGYLAHTFAAA